MASYLFIGLGGMGVRTITRIYEKLQDSPLSLENKFFCGIDFKTDQLKKFSLNPHCFRQHLEFEDPASRIENWYDKDRDNFRSWWPRSGEEIYLELRNLQDAIAGRQVRANGAAALYKCYKEVFATIAEALKNMDALKIKGTGGNIEKKIFVFNSLGGGTGSGVFPDIISFVRSEMTPGDMMYGVYFDPTVLKSFLRDNFDTNMGVAAFKELTFWMSNPSQFNKSYGNKKLLVDLRDAKSWLDGAYIVQAETNRGRVFTGDVPQKYIELVSEYFALISQSTVFESTVGANVDKRFESVKPYHGATAKFRSFGLVQVQVPQRDIAEHVTSRLITSDILLAPLSEADLPNDFIINGVSVDGKSVNLEESDISGSYLSETRAYQKLNERRSNIVKTIGSFKTGQSSFRGETRDIELDDRWFATFREEGKSALEALEATFVDRLDFLITENLPSLDFGRMIGWLDEIDADLQEELTSLYGEEGKKEEFHASCKNARTHLDETIKSLRETKPRSWGQVRRTFKEALTLVENAFDTWYKCEYEKTEAQILDPFYQNLRGHIRERKNSLNNYVEAYKAVKKHYASGSLRAKSGKTGFLRTSRATGNSYSMTLLLDNISFVDVEGTLVEQIRGSYHLQRQTLGKEGGPTNLAAFYRDEKSSTVDKIKDTLSVFVQDYVKNTVYNYVIKNLTVDTALYNHLEMRRQQVEKSKDDVVAMKKLKPKLAEEFQEHGANDLLESRDYEDPAKWRKKGLNYLLLRLRSLAQPFWNLDEIERENWWEAQNIDQMIRQPLYITLLPRSMDKIKDELEDNLNPADLPQDVSDKIVFIVEDMGTPAGSFVHGDVGAYFHNHTKALSVVEADPSFVDNRFITEEFDTASLFEEPSDKEDMEVLYLLGLSTKMISKRGSKYYLKDESKPIAESWHKLRKSLQDLSQPTTKKLAALLYDQILSIWGSLHQDVTAIQNLFTQGCEFHINEISKMVQMTDNEWIAIVQRDMNIEYQKFGDDVRITSFGPIPQNESAVKELLDELEEHSR